ncbi:MAG: hypothetical protein IKM54_01005, partial [Butyricicoccus sp.]|nr:hypothetical protein [Butyricicoccus sp.]
FQSKHYIVTYEEYHPGVMKKLLLSQPAKQGEGGIWCVERSMDENGNVYLENTNGIHLPAQQLYLEPDEYYTYKQEQVDSGDYPYSEEITDPEAVAQLFLTKTYDTARIVEIKEGTYEDFLAWPVSTYTGYIIGIDLEANHLKLMPTVYDENGEPTLWAKGYPEYYDYLPYAENAILAVDGYEKTPQAFERSLQENSNSLFAKCTYYGGQITAVKAFIPY